MLTAEEQRRIESDLARAEHIGAEVTTPPSPFHIGVGTGDLPERRDSDPNVDDIEISLNQRLASAIEEGEKVGKVN